MKYAYLLIIMATLVSGCISGSSTKPEWVHDVNWQGDEQNGTAALETEIWAQITPYNIEYDNVNITAKTEGGALRLRVTGTSDKVEYPDIYDFVYSEGTLTRTGYLLEAIQPQDRDSAITVAMQNNSVRDTRATGNPTVRRILPDTSKKYYAPKTLLSVSWSGVSALVDPQERRVVNIWIAGSSGKIEDGKYS